MDEITKEQIEALRKIADILDESKLFFDVNLIKRKAVFMLESNLNKNNERPFLILDSPVLDSETFKDIAESLESGKEMYDQLIEQSEGGE